VSVDFLGLFRLAILADPNWPLWCLVNEACRLAAEDYAFVFVEGQQFRLQLWDGAEISSLYMGDPVLAWAGLAGGLFRVVMHEPAQAVAPLAPPPPVAQTEIAVTEPSAAPPPSSLFPPVPGLVKLLLGCIKASATAARDQDGWAVLADVGQRFRQRADHDVAETCARALALGLVEARQDQLRIVGFKPEKKKSPSTAAKMPVHEPLALQPPAAASLAVPVPGLVKLLLGCIKASATAARDKNGWASAADVGRRFKERANQDIAETFARGLELRLVEARKGGTEDQVRIAKPN
jgi:hypothetical protein